MLFVWIGIKEREGDGVIYSALLQRNGCVVHVDRYQREGRLMSGYILCSTST